MKQLLICCFILCALVSMPVPADSRLFQMLDKSYNVGPNPWRSEGMLQRLKNAWIEVETCSELTFDSDRGHRVVLMGAWLTGGAWLDLACEMEKVGNRVTHVAALKAPGATFSRYFFRIALASGEEVVLDGGHEAQGQMFKRINTFVRIGAYGRLIKTETGAAYEDTDYLPRGYPASTRPNNFRWGMADSKITSFLLGKGVANLADMEFYMP